MLVGVGEVHDGARDETVNVLLAGPDAEGRGRFASVQRRNEGLVDAMRTLSVLLFRLVNSFIYAEVTAPPAMNGLMLLTWEELERRFRPGEAEAAETLEV